MRRSFLIVALSVIVLICAGAYWLAKSRSNTTVLVPREAARSESAALAPPETRAPATTEQPPSTAPAPATAAPGPVAPIRPEPSPQTRQLVAALMQVKGQITPEQAALWKTNLNQLVQQGAAAVPAIREFLEQNKDIPYDYNQGGQLLGAHSLRLGLLQALGAIGGPEAMQLAADTLQTATEPREIAQIAHQLESQAQGQYREAILHAARESLAMAAVGKLGQTDAGPLFNVLTQYGGAEAVPDMQKATSPYRYYAAIGLTQLPDGAGIPALADMLRQPNGPPRSTQNAALEALAQLAPAYPEARDKILEQARLKQVPETLWPSIADSLTGSKLQIGNLSEEGLSPQSGDKTYHLAQGPQNFYSRPNPTQLGTEQVQQVSQFIDQLLQTDLPALGLESLQRAREKLTAPPQN